MEVAQEVHANSHLAAGKAVGVVNKTLSLPRIFFCGLS